MGGFFTTSRVASPLELPIPPELQRVIDASQTDDMTSWGPSLGSLSPRPYSRLFRQRRDAAGPPHCSAHGLRKAAATSLAEVAQVRTN